MKRFATVLISFTIISLLLAIVIVFLPYRVTGTRPDGTVAWEQYERRSIFGKIVHIRTIRYNPNGTVGMRSEGGTKRFWRSDGSETSEKEWVSQNLQYGDQNVVAGKRPLSWLFGR